MSASRAINEFEVVESRLPICIDANDRGRFASDFRPSQETASCSSAKSEGIRCVRGSLLALGLEAVTVLFVYGIWEAWRLIR